MSRKPLAPGPDRRVHVLVEVERREDEDARRAARRDDPPRRLDPVELRHPDVHQDHVRLELGRQAHRLVAVLGLADDLEIVASLDDQPEAAADERLVVGDQDPDAS